MCREEQGSAAVLVVPKDCREEQGSAAVLAVPKDWARGGPAARGPRMARRGD